MSISQTPTHTFLHSCVTGLRFSLVMFVICGALYSPLTTLLAELLFPWQARGSLIHGKDTLLGSALIGQSFVSERYFHGRPSAAQYDPMATAGSNLAPDNPALRARVLADSERIQQREKVTALQIPADLLAASGSGIDPHISPASAHIQIARIAKARSMNEKELQALIEHHTEDKQFGILGQPRVNLLLLNIALDKLPLTAITAE